MTPEERAACLWATTFPDITRDDFNAAIAAAIREAVAAEREACLAALAELTDPYDDSDDRYLAFGFAAGVDAAQDAIRARATAPPP